MFLSSTNVIANALYMYLGLIFISALLGSLCFAVREYFKHPRPKHIRSLSASSTPQKRIETPEAPPARAPIQCPEPPQIASLPIVPEKRSATYKPFGKGWVIRRKKEERSPEFNSSSMVKPATSELTVRESTGKSEEISETDSGKPENSGESESAKATESGPELPKAPRFVYSEHTLRHLGPKQKEAFDPDRGVRLSEILQWNCTFPIQDPLSATEQLPQISRFISDSTVNTKCIGLFQLAAIGSFHAVFGNEIHFHPHFCTLMMSSVDSLLIYVASKHVNTLQALLVDLAACVAWEHWNSGRCPKLALAAKMSSEPRPSAGSEALASSADMDYSASAQSLNGPVVLDQPSVFRLLCNLYLGSPAMATSVRPALLLKLSAVLRDCASRTACLQFRALVPILGRAVTATQRGSIKAVFYDVLIELVQPHVLCCVAPQDVFSPTSEIQALVLQGLWVEQPDAVRERSAKMAALLAQKFPAVGLWSKPLHHAPLGGPLAGTFAPGTWNTR